MRIIKLIGVMMFLYPTLYKCSFRAFFILINGILYHYHNNNIYNNKNIKLLRLYDITSNMSFMAYTVYYYRYTLHIANLMTICFILNNIFLKKYNSYNKKYLFYISDIFHVIGVQFPGLIAIMIS
jgi:hypothetical protein